MDTFNLIAKSDENVKDSAISDQFLQRGCLIDFGHFDMLASDTNKIRPLIL